MTRVPHPNQRARDELPAELRRTTVPALVRAWIERVAGGPGARVASVRRLPGASTSAVHRIDLDNASRLVLRRYVWRWVLDDDPVVLAREVDALTFARTKGLPAPGVVAADTTGGDVGDGIPALLMTFMPGQPLANPDPWRLAEAAAAIHAVDPGDFGYDYFPWWDDVSFRPPHITRRPKLWEQAYEVRVTARPPYRPTFVHRDFHPGNVLWVRGRCAGVVDWVNGCRGPAGCDLAACRANLLDLARPADAEALRAAYESVTGEPFHPYWDLAAALELGPSHWTNRDLAGREQLLERALAACR